MSTNAAIITKTETGYAGIYCHFDGYPDGVGKTLKEHYTNPNKVADLIDLGDISQLGRFITGSVIHSYATPENDITVAYHRDRGESKNKAKTGATWKEVANQIDGEYNYIFDGSKWSLQGF